jgi:hypothetical protein
MVIMSIATAGDAGLEQITLQHGVVLRHDGNHHGWVFRLHWLPRTDSLWHKDAL